MGSIAFVGMDVHKATIAVAVAEGVRGGEVRQLGIFANRAEVVAKLAGRLASSGSEACRGCLRRCLPQWAHTSFTPGAGAIPQSRAPSWRNRSSCDEPTSSPFTFPSMLKRTTGSTERRSPR